MTSAPSVASAKPAPSATPTASASPGPTPIPTAPATPTPAPTAAGKAPLHGLVAMGNLDFNDVSGASPDNGLEEINAHPGVYVAAVINVTWAQLEPQPGVFDDGAIESALANVRAYNALYPRTPVVAKLRVYMGVNAPAWIVAQTGPVTIVTKKGSGMTGAFWSAAYESAWQALQAHLAGTYDGNALVGEVAVTSCSSLTAEPFVISTSAGSLASMRSYGFSDAAYQACLANAPADYAGWTRTPLDYTFNQYNLTDGPSLVLDPAFPIAVMQSFRSSLGARGVLANHALQPTPVPAVEPIYAEIQTLGPPIEFQADSPQVDWNATIALGLSLGATEFEIWPTIAAGGAADISLGQLQTWAAEFQAQPLARPRRTLR